MKKFITENGVFISGLLAAITLVLQQYITQPGWDLMPLLVACGLAVLGFIANEWRGKGMTLLGIIGTLAYTFLQVYNGGQIDWKQFVLLTIVALLTAVSPPAKPARYEDSPPIANAKRK